VRNNVDGVVGNILRKDLARVLQGHVDGAERSNCAAGNLSGDVNLLNNKSSLFNHLLEP